MMAGESIPAGGPAGATLFPEEMHDDLAEWGPGHPLHDALSLCREVLGPAYDAAAARASGTERRRSSLALGATAAGAAALVLAITQLAFAAAGRLAAAAAGPLAWAAGLLALASLVLLAARAAGPRRKGWLADRAAVERCRSAKFRFLLDPALWSRRGSEAEERAEQFRAEAAALARPGPDTFSSWIASDTVPVARAIGVGSGIDPHTVHTLMDYYQARRLDPQLGRLARESAAKSTVAPSAGLVFGASVALVLVQAALVVGAAVRPGLRLALIAAAAALPFAGAVWGAIARRSAPPAPERAGARHRALSELSQRLQKVSGSEAIFRELGFCEDVLESEGRDRLRRDLAAGWLG